MTNAELKTIVSRAARLGGEVLMDYRGRFTARQKAPRDLVTDADEASQRVIAEYLMKEVPGSVFVGEESGTSEVRPESGQWCWIVDPLDGTANYVHRLQNFSVSVAVAKDDKVVAGAVFDPISNEMYAAAFGEGATRNDTPIRASGCELIEDALIACSFASNVHRNAPEIKQFVEVLVRSQAVRRLGSAALNLCYVAAGCLDAYWALSVKAWDVAAGQLIAREAGAILTNDRGLEFELWNPKLAVSATPSLHRTLVELLNL